ncbi:MAG: SDR family oxidoreductase [Acidimicrobiaceae bacterium]|nr:SDR family oxidoreductase [Acidimicrobiaceae bacterium]
MTLVEGKIAIVTGAAQGLGAESARTLARHGARVLLCDINAETCRAVAAEIGSAADAFELDVTDEDQWATAVRYCQDTFGPVDILVNNAGIARFSPLESTSLEMFEQTMAVNTTGVFLGMRAVFEPMRRNGGGSIVNISSANGFIASDEVGAYVTSKFAVRGLTRSAAFEWGRYGIRANSVCPGMINTAMMIEEEESYTHKITTLERVGQPHEIANTVLFLASDQSSYATGADFVIDGGIMAGVRVREANG